MKTLFFFLVASWIPFSSISQTVLSKVVISNGGQLTSNNVFRLNLSVGQPIVAKTQTEASEASIGFWYEVTGVTNKPFVLEKFKVSEKVIVNPIDRGADLKIYPNPFLINPRSNLKLLKMEK
jgi:predicted acyltransferase (DUF342 family)